MDLVPVVAAATTALWPTLVVGSGSRVHPDRISLSPDQARTLAGFLLEAATDADRPGGPS